jgi:hypothetical protein
MDATETRRRPRVKARHEQVVIKLLDALYAGGLRIFSHDQWHLDKPSEGVKPTTAVNTAASIVGI